MPRADVKLFEVLADQAAVDILWCLLDSDDPLTQRELVSRLEISSGLASKRMGELELIGIIERPSSHGPYSVVLPKETRSVLDAAIDLAASAQRRLGERADTYKRERRKAGLSGGHLRDQEKEAHGGHA